jgi:dihydroneopterin aldolase
MDTVHLRSELACVVGILPRERVEPQRITVDVRMELDLESVGTTGDLGEGVDYAAVDALLRFLAVEGRFRLLESFALAALRGIVAGPVQRATIDIRKPDVLRAATPGVSATRDAAWARSAGPLDLVEVRVDYAGGDGHADRTDGVGGTIRFTLHDGRVVAVTRRPWTP